GVRGLRLPGERPPVRLRRHGRLPDRLVVRRRQHSVRFHLIPRGSPRGSGVPSPRALFRRTKTLRVFGNKAPDGGYSRNPGWLGPAPTIPWAYARSLGRLQRLCDNDSGRKRPPADHRRHGRRYAFHMCGRYTQMATWAELWEYFNLVPAAPVEVVARYNVAPSQAVPVVRADADGQRTLAMLKWGFVPSWSKDGKIAPINAMSETVTEKPMFRGAFKKRRCLIAADGF